MDNTLSTYFHELRTECPGKTWWDANAMHPAIFRALKINRDEEGAIYAAAAFRLHMDDEGACILGALPCPPLFDERGDNWFDIEQVIRWDPVSNTACLLGDDAALIGHVPQADETANVYGDPFTYLRAYAEARARWFITYQSVNGGWRRKPHEPDLTPGLLLLGDVNKARWPVRTIPNDIACHGVDAQAVNRAIIRQAHLPRARRGHENRIAA